MHPPIRRDREQGASHLARSLRAVTLNPTARNLLATVVIVGLLTVGVTSLVFDFVLGDVAGIIAGAVALVVIAVIWLLIPRTRVSDSWQER